MAVRSAPEINAGSMADIAFLLLIFFLVATTMNVDTVIQRKLPQKQPPNAPKPDIEIKEKNVFEIIVNRYDQLMVEKELSNVTTLKDKVVKFLDNGGGVGKNNDKCDYCRGDKDPASSDHPSKAVISLKTDRGTSYEMFIKVQDAIGQAYIELRNRESERIYGISYEELLFQKTKDKDNAVLDRKIEAVKALYPEIISEVEPTTN